jgi:HD-like signal output (HDOD) protein
MTAELPVLPAPHARALTILSDPDVELAAVAEVISGDPALTAAVLRAANSAASAPLDPITTADRAVTRIGLDGARNILSGVVVGSSFRNLREAGLEADELWKHLVVCALVANEALEPGERGPAFTAGLLHDLGRMAMAHSEPRRYRRVVSRVKSGADPREAERGDFGLDHEMWGERVASAWGLPDELTMIVAHHHGSGESRLGAAVMVARRIAASLGYGDGVTAPAAPTSLDLDDRVHVASLGGAGQLAVRVEWFQSVLEPGFGSDSALTHSRRESRPDRDKGSIF